jgi:SAM-dependent methyltransferase
MWILREANIERHRELKQHIGELWGADECTVRKCLECDFAFADPFVAGDLRYYNLAFERDGYRSDKWEFTRTLEEIEASEFHAGRVLEVGAGVGDFLDKLADRHVPRSGITALEFGDRAVIALGKKGYTAIQDDLLSAKLDPGFDGIFLFQVLEHLDNLDARFNRISSLLREGGLAFMATPNPRWIHFNEQNGSLIDMPPNHIGRWSERAFKVIGARHSLRLDRHEVEPFSFKEFVRHDISFSYMRLSQQSGSIANLARSLRKAPFGKLIGVATAAAIAPRRIGAWRRAAKEQGLGLSSWVKYTKVDRMNG